MILLAFFRGDMREYQLYLHARLLRSISSDTDNMEAGIPIQEGMLDAREISYAYLANTKQDI